MKYKTTGTCAPYILFDVDAEKRVHNIEFIGGCLGNLRAIAILIEGMKIDEAIAKLKGIQCRNGTSCADQLAKALQKYESDPTASE